MSLLGMTAMAQDRGSMSLAILGNLSNANVPDSVENGASIETDNGFGLGAALGFLHKANEGLSVETGISLLNRKRVYGNDTFRLVQNEWNVRIPLIVKLHLGSILAFGLGPYLGIPIGDVRNTFEVGDASVAGFDTDNASKVELGGLVAAMVTLPLSEDSVFFIEARYLRGLTDLGRDDTRSSYSDDIEGLFGYRVSL